MGRAPCSDERTGTPKPGTRLHIALVAPPWYQVPPAGYGGIEAMVALLADELVDRGHDVTLFAAGPAGTRARQITTFEQPPSDRIGQANPELLHALLVTEALSGVRVDIVHDHSFAGPLLAPARAAPTVVSVHGPVDGELGEYYACLPGGSALVAISAAQHQRRPDLPRVGTVHNAVRYEKFRFRERKRNYALFLGRMSPDKAPEVAIAVARRVGIRLIMAAKCREPQELAHFSQVVQPLLGPDVDWLGEVDEARKRELLADAACLIFPIQWGEPFGMVLLEAMASGTPVIALRAGSVPEIVRHGITGFICDDADAMAAAFARLNEIDAHACRARVVASFSPAAMAQGYEEVYARVIASPRLGARTITLPDPALSPVKGPLA